MVLTTNTEIGAGTAFSVSITGTNKASAQASVAPTVEATLASVVGHVPLTAVATVTNLGIIAPEFSARDISGAGGASQSVGASNTITLVFQSTVDLASGDTVTVRGLTIANDADTNALALTGTDSAKFSSNGVVAAAEWTNEGGVLALTANQPVSGSTTVSFSITNKGTAVASVTPTIEAVIAGTSGVAVVDTVPVNMAVGSAFTASSISGTSQLEGATNTITIALTCASALVAGDVITIAGLTNLQNANNAKMALSGPSKAKFTPKGSCLPLDVLIATPWEPYKLIDEWEPGQVTTYTYTGDCQSSRSWSDASTGVLVKNTHSVDTLGNTAGIMAFGWSGSFNDFRESITFTESNCKGTLWPIRHRCSDPFIALNYGSQGVARCQTMHGPFSGSNQVMIKRIQSVPVKAVKLRLKMRIFFSGETDPATERIRVSISRSNEAYSRNVQTWKVVWEEILNGDCDGEVYADDNTWRIWNDGIFSSVSGRKAYENTDKSLPGLRSANNQHKQSPKPACHALIDEIIDVSKQDHSTLWVKIDGNMNAAVNNGVITEYWGFDQFELSLVEEEDSNSDAREKCPGEVCPNECLGLSPANGADIDKCRSTLRGLTDSQCTISPFGKCRGLCGDEDFWCARNQPFPTVVFYDTTTLGSALLEVDSVTVVIHGLMMFEATEEELKSQGPKKGSITFNNVSAGDIESVGTPGKFSCSSPCHRSTAIIDIKNGNVPYVYATGRKNLTLGGLNTVQVTPPPNQMWCLSKISVNLCTVPAPPIIKEISSVPGTNISRLDPRGGEVIVLKGVGLGPRLGKVTYGPEGVGFFAENCTVQDAEYTEVHCRTVEGMGRNLYWKMAANGRWGELVEGVQTSYLLPKIIGVVPMEIPSQGTLTVTLAGSNLDFVPDLSTAFIRVNSVNYNSLEFKPGVVTFIIQKMTRPTANISIVFVQSALDPATLNKITWQVSSNNVLVHTQPPYVLGAFLTSGPSSSDAALTITGKSFCSKGAGGICAEFTMCPDMSSLSIPCLTKTSAFEPFSNIGIKHIWQDASACMIETDLDHLISANGTIITIHNVDRSRAAIAIPPDEPFVVDVVNNSLLAVYHWNCSELFFVKKNETSTELFEEEDDPGGEIGEFGDVQAQGNITADGEEDEVITWPSLLQMDVKYIVQEHQDDRLVFRLPALNMFPVDFSATVFGVESNTVRVTTISPEILQDSIGLLRNAVYRSTEFQSAAGSLWVNGLSLDKDKIKVEFKFGANSSFFPVLGVNSTLRADGSAKYNIVFDIPAGQGKNVLVSVWMGVMPSAPIAVSYPPPSIKSIRPKYVSTEGGLVEIKGSNFGAFLHKVSIRSQDVLMHIPVYNHTHRSLFVMFPQGEGGQPMEFIVSSGNQQSCRVLGQVSCGTELHEWVYYGGPVIHSLILPNARGTEGSFIVKVAGINFGTPNASVSVHVAMDHECLIISRTHRLIVCSAPAGEGSAACGTSQKRRNVISIFVNGQKLPGSVTSSSLLGQSGFSSTVYCLSYSPPRIYSFSIEPSVSGFINSHIPTSGRYRDSLKNRSAHSMDGELAVSNAEFNFLRSYYGNSHLAAVASITREGLRQLLEERVDQWSEAIVISIHGENFGGANTLDRQVSFVVDDERVPATILSGTHNLIRAETPPGHGASQIVVTVRDQEYYFDFTYGAPIIQSVQFLPSNGKYSVPTSGCAEYHVQLAGTEDRVCMDGKEAKFVVRGENFGLSFPQIFLMGKDGEKHECSVLSANHYMVEVNLAPGIGRFQVLLFSVQPGFASPPRLAASSSWYSYSLPDVQDIVWGDSIDSASVSWSYNAVGTGKLFIFGDNFGVQESSVNVTLDGIPCLTPKWHKASKFSLPPGTPYVTCHPQKALVGPKLVRLEVAKAVVAVGNTPGQGSLDARCFQGFYGKIGEYCLPCWSFTDSSGRLQTAATCSGRFFRGRGELNNDTLFEDRGGAEEPVPLQGFSTFPPPECANGGCRPLLSAMGSNIPLECIPLPGRTYREGWKLKPRCTAAETVGKVCHPDRFGGYCESTDEGIVCASDPVNENNPLPKNALDFVSIRHGCLYAIPCVPSEACGINNTCVDGYVSYYEPYRYDKAVYEGEMGDGSEDYRVGKSYTRQTVSTVQCNIGHFTLPDGSCYAPRCSQCKPNTHFRMDGFCIPCPEYPWLIPLAMCVCGLMGAVGMLGLSRSGVSFTILNISIDYFQVLSLFAGSRIKWPSELTVMFKYLRFFAVDIDLAAPECLLDNLVTFENKFYFKMALPFLCMGLLVVGIVMRIGQLRLQEILAPMESTVKKKNNTRVNPIQTPKTPKEVPAVGETVALEGKDVSGGEKMEAPTKEKYDAVSTKPNKTKTRRKREKLTTEAVLSMVVQLFITLVYFLYLTITRAALDIFNCEPTKPPSGKYYLSGAPLEECGIPGGLQDRLIPTATFFLLLYTLGFPVFIGFLYWNHGHRVKADQLLCAEGREGYPQVNKNYYFRKRYGKLYYPYKPEFYWWTFVILARKVFLVYSAVLLRGHSDFQLAAVLCFMFIALCAHIEYDPYMHIREKSDLLASQARQKVEAQIIKSRVIHIVMDLQEKITGKNHDTLQEESKKMKKEIEEMQVEIKLLKAINERMHHAWFNYNNVEFIALSCSVIVPVTGIMFNSEYLQYPENKVQKSIITYVTIILVGSSLLYLLVCIGHEIRNTKEARRQRSLLLWARLRFHRQNVVDRMLAYKGEVSVKYKKHGAKLHWDKIKNAAFILGRQTKQWRKAGLIRKIKTKMRAMSMESTDSTEANPETPTPTQANVSSGKKNAVKPVAKAGGQTPKAGGMVLEPSGNAKAVKYAQMRPAQNLVAADSVVDKMIEIQSKRMQDHEEFKNMVESQQKARILIDKKMKKMELGISEIEASEVTTIIAVDQCDETLATAAGEASHVDALETPVTQSALEKAKIWFKKHETYVGIAIMSIIFIAFVVSSFL